MKKQNQVETTNQIFYSFEYFCTNKNNIQAFLSARAVAEQSRDIENPLYIYGSTRTGKTHILYAIEQYINEHKPEVNVVRVSSVDYVEEVIDAIKTRKMNELRKKYRSADVLLVDDIDFLANKELSMEEFHHLFNTLYEGGKQIVITGNASPRELMKEGLSEKLVSRLEWGKIVEIPFEDQKANEK